MTKLSLALAALVGLTSASSVAEAAFGDIYDGALSQNSVYRITPSGSSSVFYADSSRLIDSVAFDRRGNLFCADKANAGAIVEVTPSGTATVFASGLSPQALAFDSSGNLFVIDGATNSILKFTPAGAKTTFASGITSGRGLAFDSSDNLFVTLSNSGAAGAGTVVKYTASGTMTTFATGLSTPWGVVVDNLGNVYVAELPTGNVYKFTPSGVKTTLQSGFGSPYSLALDRVGDLIVGEFGNHQITKVPLIGPSAGTKSIVISNIIVGGLAIEPPSSAVVNLSTRALVQTGDQVAIAGFAVRGTTNKMLLLRGLGPSLTRYGVPNALQDPYLELHNSAGAVIAANDNWQSASNSGSIPSGYTPPDPRESAIWISLPPGNYTAILSGKNATSGSGLVEVYDFDTYSTPAELVNVSTRGYVGTGNFVMIGGFACGITNGSSTGSPGGNGIVEVVVRGLGPTLAQAGVAGALANPVVQLKNAQGTTIAFNDDSKNAPPILQYTGFAPPNGAEAGLVAFLTPGTYTAILSGANNTTGVGLVEVYKVVR
ncbi:MAG: NHL repeat-containing protein [Verrucomicrobia bacterium]|nr:NHL repeat-containing protein [Verrucomicrobiota bacterium]